MNAIVKGKIFKSRNSAAVRLLKELGFAPGTEVTLERIGSDLRMRALFDPVDAEEGKRRVRAMIAALAALPPGGEFGERLEIDIPERATGL